MTKRRHQPPALAPREFVSVEEIDLAIAKLRRRVQELEQLDVPAAIWNHTGADSVARSNIRETIREVFGSNSPEFVEHQHISLWAGPMYIGMSNEAVIQSTDRGRIQVIGILNGLIGRLEEKRGDLTAEAAQDSSTRLKQAMEATPHEGILVFISHSNRDADLAFALIELLKAGLALQSTQIRCSSVDGYRLPVGVNTEAKLREEVNAAKVVIGLITPSSLASAFVMFELGARWGANRFLAPLLAGVEPSALRGPLSLLNALSASSEPQLHQLLKDVARQLEVPLQDVSSYVRYISAVKDHTKNVSASPESSSHQAELIFEESVYWKRKNGEREGPYCPVCYDHQQKEIHLTPGATKGTYLCGVCQNSFYSKEYDPRPTRRRPFSSR